MVLEHSPRELFRRLGPSAFAGILTLTLPALGIFLVWRYSDELTRLVQSLGGPGPLVYAAFFGAAAGLALFPTWVQAVLAGFVFGTALGLPIAAATAVGSCVVGAAVGYGLGRLLAQDRVRRTIDENPRWRAIREALVASGFWHTLGLVAMVRLPSSPFAFTNLAMAAIKAPFVPYILGTLVGIAPRTVVAAFVGRQLTEFSKEAVKESRPLWLVIAGIVALLVAVAVLGHVAKRALARVTGDGRNTTA